MKKNLLNIILLFFSITAIGNPTDLGTTYIEAWKKFYPSKAVAQGIHTAIFDYEHLAEENIQQWLDFNQHTLKELQNPQSVYVQQNRIDARLLKVQVKKEIDKWEQKAIHRHSLTLYSKLIEKATEELLTVTYLSKKEKTQLICKRLLAIQNLCVTARKNIKQLDEKEVERGVAQLQKALIYYGKTLPDKTTNWRMSSSCPTYQNITDNIQSLIKYIETTVAPAAIANKPILGKTEYAKQLALYTDSDLTPKQLEAMALEEIETVRQLKGSRFF